MTDQGPLGGRRLLVVEDAYLLARDFCEWLEQAGATILGPYPDAEAAETILGEEHCDGALLGIDLGDDANRSLARSLRAARKPFLITTGYDRLSIPDELDGIPQIQKPFRSEQLVSAVASLFEPRPAAG